MGGRRRVGAAADGGAGSGACSGGAELAAAARGLDETARLLRRLARDQDGPAAPLVLPPPRDGAAPGALHVRAIIAVRRLRTAYLPDLSGDHAFSMLLELYAARLEGRRIAQTRLGSAAGVPHATAIRIIQALQDEGMVASAGDPADRRLTLLALTDEAAARMEAYLTATLSAAPGLV